jgi:Fanconi-associated nuclease 1
MYIMSLQHSGTSAQAPMARAHAWRSESWLLHPLQLSISTLTSGDGMKLTCSGQLTRVLQDSSQSKHNAMLGQKIPHPKSTRFDGDGDDDDDFATPPAKRVKRDITDFIEKASPKDAPKVKRNVIPDSDDDSEREDLPAREETPMRTDLESALPLIETDKEAIEAYEASRAVEQTDLGLRQRLDERKWTRGKTSIYVDAFNLALETVLEEESHLFDEAEHTVFKRWHELSYESQYLYVRLFLRKTSSWHRIGRLGYHGDVANMQAAIDELQLRRELPAASSQNPSNPGETEPPEGTTLGEDFAFADRSQDCIKDLEEASSLLLLDELKGLAKDAKVQGKNKKELLRNLRKASGQQTALSRSGSLKRSDTEDTTASTKNNQVEDSSREATPGRLENRDSHFVDKIMAETGPCIRLSLPTLKLFERVHLVFYRSTEWTEKSLTTIILARIARRNFPDYIVSRSANIFPSRSLLLEFEAAVRTQYKVDNILEFSGNPSKDGLEVVLEIFDQVLPRWKTLLVEEQRKEDSIYSTGEGAYLRRLSPAWVYTRIVHKGAYVLGTGKFKDHKREHEVLCALLSQRLFHTSRRGDWYQRKALLEEHYMHLHLPAPAGCKDIESKKKHFKRMALQTCEQGLQDQLTHLIFHRDLQKRTTKLEKSLKIPKRQQHDFEHVQLTKAEERAFEGIRIERARNLPRRNSDPTAKLQPKRGGKTIWLDPALTLTPEDGEADDPETRKSIAGGECSVEAMCLSSYRALGWKGYHSEGRILRTLFAYLFYDVLFLYMPNVFQTAYQTCPLDLHTDAFYPSRISEVHARLNAISNGDAAALIRRVHDDHHARQTCVVGLDWSFERDDLLEIAACFLPAALSTVMKVMVQEYGQRGGGVPDLFLWRCRGEGASDGGEVMFAEVKSENDRLSDTQRMWIDVLSGAGVRVELCHAVAREVRVRQ